MMKIAIGADGYGFELKEAVKQYLKEKGWEVQDDGVDSANDSRITINI